MHDLNTALEMYQVHFSSLCTIWKLTEKVLIVGTSFWKSLGNYLEMGSVQALGTLCTEVVFAVHVQSIPAPSGINFGSL